MNAADIMTHPVLSVSPETSLVQVHRLFSEEQIHGAPVVDGQENLVGVITSSDLLRAVAIEHESAGGEADYLRDALAFSAPDWNADSEDFQDRLAQLRVEEVMTRSVASVPAETPVAEVAAQMRKNGIHQIYVEVDRRLRGVISTFDFLSLIEKADL
jgi:CBS domain-containing protein